jgi:glutathione synthase/RimK-type ligase-like ATP-grasp enzyme
MKKKIGFYKKEQGIFTKDYIADIKNAIVNEIDCELIEVDFRDGIIINDKVFVDDICLNDLDIYFWHDTVYPRNWQSDNYFLHILKIIEKDVSVINTGTSTQITNDKFLSHTSLKNAGLPVGDFALVQAENINGLRRIFENFNQDVLLKPRFGGWGIGIARAQKIDELISTIEYMLNFTNNSNQSILIEKFYPNDLSKWISVVVFGNNVIFGYKKPLIGDADWKIYDPQKSDGKGTMSKYVNPPQDLKKIAIAAKNAIGKDIIGFDFIYTDDGYKIIDENGRPGLYPQCIKSGNINITNEIIQLIKNKS